MKYQQLGKRIRKGVAKAKKESGILVEDGAAQLGRFGDTVSRATDKARDDLNTWVGDGVSQLSEGFEKLTGDTRELVIDAAATAKKDVGHGLSQYNAQAQKVADKVPGGFGNTVARYPWVAISIGLAVGFLVGILLKPARQASW
jgi:ElaB/YqjD/DUF883 family membrane-anchored ribosome-binding protein